MPVMYKYCYLCGSPTETVKAHGGNHWKCTGCGQTFFSNPKPAAEIVLIDEQGRIVVAVRGRDPHKGKLDLPGGFVDTAETLEQGVVREIEEELGLTPHDYSRLVYVSSSHNLYPWVHEISNVVAAAFTARIHSSVKITPQDDVAKVRMMTLPELSMEEFAWPAQYTLVKAAVDYWKNRA